MSLINNSGLHTAWMDIQVPGDDSGTVMETYVARPEGEGTWPLVLVLMEIFGVNEHIQEVTRHVAQQGYVAAAINYYHRTTPNLNLGYTEADMQAGWAHKERTTADNLAQDARAAIDILQASPYVANKQSVGVMGFCFGGHVAYLLATRPAQLPEIKAVASFYGGGIAKMTPGKPAGLATVDETPNIKAEMLCLFGEKDPLITREEMDTIGRALAATSIPHRVVRYPEAGHGFCCDQRADFNAEACQDAWQQMLAMFERQLKATAPV